MEFTLVIAKVFAIYLVASGLSVLFKKKTMALVLKDFYEHPATMYVTGFILIFLGGYLAFTLDAQSGTVETWIVIISWLTLLKGIAYILIPEKVAELGKNFPQAWWGPAGLLMVILGIWLIIAVR